MTSWWARWRLKSPASRSFTQKFIQAQINENIKAPHHWPLWGEFTGYRWIPRTKGKLRVKCFHLMTSSCSAISLPRTMHVVKWTTTQNKPFYTGMCRREVIFVFLLYMKFSSMPLKSRSNIRRYIGHNVSIEINTNLHLNQCWLTFNWNPRNTFQ